MAKKKDDGHDETEQVLADLEKRINKEYAQAEQEVQEKLDDYLRRFKVKDEIKRQAWQDGKITKQEYEQWRYGQICIGERWQEMKDTLAEDYTNAAEIAKSITDGYMPDVYAINHNYGTYQVEQGAMVDTSYTLYNRQSVQRLFNDDNKLYHDYGIKVGQQINAGKQMAWDKKQIQSVMTQALLQGESIGNIATRLSKTVGDSDRKACIRNARTMTTGVENAGRVDSYKRAQNMGIELMQEWLATLDSRTRHEHRQLDGQRVKVGEPFKIDGYELDFPADPKGAAHLVYNCRCTLVPVIKGFEIDASDLSERNTNKMQEQTYEEWKNAHNSVSDPITKQDDIAKTMQIEYGQEYKDLKNFDSLVNEQQNLLNKYGNTTNMMLFGSADDVARWQELQQWTSMDEKALRKVYSQNADNWEEILKNQTEKQMDKFTEQLLDIATDKELAALNMWTGETYANINRYMRYGHNVDDISKSAANDIKNCLDKIKTTEDIVVHRGTGIKEILDGVQGDWRNNLDLLIGHTYTDNGFVATSPLPTGGFSGAGLNQAELFIKVPQGTHGAYIAKEAHNELEKEFLLQSGYRYKIIKAEYRPNPFFPDEKDLKLWVEVIQND